MPSSVHSGARPGPWRVAAMSGNDACSLERPLTTHGKRQMTATSGHPLNEAFLRWRCRGSLQASDITARHEGQQHT